MAPHKIVLLFITSMILRHVGMLQQFMLVLMWGPSFCGVSSDEHAEHLNPPLVAHWPHASASSTDSYDVSFATCAPGKCNEAARFLMRCDVLWPMKRISCSFRFRIGSARFFFYSVVIFPRQR